jgi:hypothetical protein
MKEKQLAEFTDQELLDEAKKDKLSPIVTALFIGFMAGVVIYSTVKGSWGFLATGIPLYFIYHLVKGSKRNEEVEKLLQERGLK